MPHMQPLRREDHPELEELFLHYDRTLSFVPNSLFTMARRPAILRAFSELITQIWNSGTLPTELKPLIGIVSSIAAGCRYCQAHEAVDARERQVADVKIRDIWDFERSARYSEAERAALRFARDASLVPNEVTAAHFDELRRHWDDGQIVEILSVVGLFGFLNRWNDTMATELESTPMDVATERLGERWEPGKHAPDQRAPGPLTPLTVVVFDVNGTLLDLGALVPAFIEAFADPRALDEWFARLLHGSVVATMLGTYEPFDVIATEALDSMAVEREVELDPDRRGRIVAGLRSLPVYPDVDRALARLHSAGLRLAALTNSPRPFASEQLANAGLAGRFDAVLSVDLVERFKPHPDVYRAAASELGVPIGAIRLVAAHDWDVAGAIAAGARGAFVARAGATYRPWLPRPDIEGADLGTVADAILAVPFGEP
jgi:2-haloacid dehalogenase